MLHFSALDVKRIAHWQPMDLTKLRELAAELHVEVTNDLLVRLFARMREDGEEATLLLEVAVELAQRDAPGWTRRVLRLYPEARAEALKNNDINLAIQFGSACNRPVTEEEALAVAARLEWDARRDTPGARERRNAAVAYAADAIAKAVGAPPSPSRSAAA